MQDLELRKLNIKQLQRIPTGEKPIHIAKIRKDQEFETPDTTAGTMRHRTKKQGNWLKACKRSNLPGPLCHPTQISDYYSPIPAGEVVYFGKMMKQ